MSGYVLAAGGGDTYDWRGARVTLKTTGAETHGQLSVIDSVYPPGLTVPSHVHDGEDEMFYVLDGGMHGFCDDEEWTATPGMFIFVPRDRPHGFTVIGDQPARALVVVGPPNLDRSIITNGVPVGPDEARG